MPKGKYTIGYVSFLNKCFVDKVNDLKGLIAKKRNFIVEFPLFLG